MTIQELTDIFSAFFPWGFIKLIILILMTMYLIFAAVIVRQEQLMARVIEIPYSPYLRSLAIIHFIATLVIYFIIIMLV